MEATGDETEGALLFVSQLERKTERAGLNDGWRSVATKNSFDMRITNFFFIHNKRRKDSFQLG